MHKLAVLSLFSAPVMMLAQVAPDGFDLNSLLDYGLLGLIVIALVAVIQRIQNQHIVRQTALEADINRLRDKYERLLLSLLDSDKLATQRFNPIEDQID